MKFLIWSTEHGAWWKPDGQGHTPHKKEAGEYPLERAIEICRDANRNSKNLPTELMVPAY